MKRNRILWLSLLAVMAAVGWQGYSRWERAQLPQYEGRTADEWLDVFARRLLWSPRISLEEVDLKESELVFRSLGIPAQRQLIEEFVRYEELNGLLKWLGSVGRRWPDRFQVGPFWERQKLRHAVCGETLGRIRPDWDAFALVYERTKARGDLEQLRLMFEVLQYVGRGGEHSVPILLEGLEGEDGDIKISSSFALCIYGTNAAAALGPLLLRLGDRAEYDWEPDFFGNLGLLAVDALPVLERWFRQATLPSERRD